MRSFAFVALTAVAVGGCQPDCLQSADILVAITPPPGVSPSLVKQLQVTIAIGADGELMSVASIPLTSPLQETGSSFLLRPATVPGGAYQLSVIVTAADSTGTPMAIGTDTEQIQSDGCNHMSVHLASLIGGGSGGGGTGGGGGAGGGGTGGGGGLVPPDMSNSTADMQGCFGGTPDEDNDGRADTCDVCAADPEPLSVTNADGDGLPDACDPDINRAGNRLVYFEPFNSDAKHWSESNTPGSSIAVNSTGSLEMKNSGSGQLYSGNSVDTMPVNVRVQTWYDTNGPLNSQHSNTSSMVGLLLGNGPDLNQQNTSGVLCSVNSNTDQQNQQPTLEIDHVSCLPNGQCGVLTPADSLGFRPFPTGQTVRIRLTQVGSAYTCELATLNPDNTVTLVGQVTMTQSAPTASQYISVVAINLADTKFHSVVAETALP